MDNNRFQEALMLICMQNMVVEATSSNLFFVKNNCLCTPKIEYCGVAGTIRQQILDLALKHDIVIQQAVYSLTDLSQASEIFLCNSIFGIVPLRTIYQVDEIFWNSDSQKQTLADQSVSFSQFFAAIINTAIHRPNLMKS